MIVVKKYSERIQKQSGRTFYLQDYCSKKEVRIVESNFERKFSANTKADNKKVTQKRRKKIDSERVEVSASKFHTFAKKDCSLKKSNRILSILKVVSEIEVYFSCFYTQIRFLHLKRNLRFF
jgi:Na+/phosphate symporter